MANPVLQKELRTRLRSRKGRKVQLALGIPAVLVILICYARLLLALRGVRHDDGDIWMACAMIQLGLICFLAPGLLANAISQEKEQRTWGLLLITRLTSWQIISGKLIARLMPIPVIMVFAAPFMAFSAVVSHLRWPVIVATYGILFAALLLFGVQALFWSWLLKRTSAAVATSYGFVFLWCAGTYIAMELIEAGDSTRDAMKVLWANPFYIMGELLGQSARAISRHVGLEMIVFFAICVALSAIMLIIMKDCLGRTQAE